MKIKKRRETQPTRKRQNDEMKDEKIGVFVGKKIENYRISSKKICEKKIFVKFYKQFLTW